VWSALLSPYKKLSSCWLTQCISLTQTSPKTQQKSTRIDTCSCIYQNNEDFKWCLETTSIYHTPSVSALIPKWEGEKTSAPFWKTKPFGLQNPPSLPFHLFPVWGIPEFKTALQVAQATVITSDGEQQSHVKKTLAQNKILEKSVPLYEPTWQTPGLYVLFIYLFFCQCIKKMHSVLTCAGHSLVFTPPEIPKECAKVRKIQHE